ncbi:MAG: CDP-2,3-bis-(O-geranylgeranyl)-sn-glycerol synthase [Ignisphaera sp.]|uniref:CDP-archaeol synthase n=1 Tax=Ignisphaera aggregans TaxID=334771 RepID=A0A7C4NJ32_9CREN
MEVLKDVLTLIWIILPAYVANGSPVIGAKILDRAGFKRCPIDKGRHFIDGRRIFGDNKTWEGLAIGIVSGVIVGFIQFYLCYYDLEYIIRSTALSVGAMVGDLLGAFIKRRLGIRPGDPLPFLDQTLFLFVALAFAYSLSVISITVLQLSVLTIITIFLHVVTNLISYKLKLKDVPW